MQNQVNDLRSAIELLKGIPGQYIETDVEVDPIDELSGVYRRIEMCIRDRGRGASPST